MEVAKYLGTNLDEKKMFQVFCRDKMSTSVVVSENNPIKTPRSNESEDETNETEIIE